MPEYFIVANSMAAPIVSDTSYSFVVAASPKKALQDFAASYAHPFGLYAAVAFASAESFHKNRKPLARWLSSRALAQESDSGGVVVA